MKKIIFFIIIFTTKQILSVNCCNIRNSTKKFSISVMVKRDKINIDQGTARTVCAPYDSNIVQLLIVNDSNPDFGKIVINNPKKDSYEIGCDWIENFCALTLL